MMETLSRPLAGSPGLVVVRAAAWPSWLKSRYFSLGLFTLALPFICLVARPLDGDIWWVLANARVLVQSGGLLNADPFTYAPHTPTYVDAQWLAQLGYYAAYQALGLEGVAVFNAAAVALAFAIMLHVAWGRSRSAPAAFAANILAVLTATPFLLARAATLAVVPFAATTWLLTCERGCRARLVAIGVVAAIWTNLHGSFFLGPLLTLALVAGEVAEAARDGQLRAAPHSPRLRFLASAIAAQALGSLVNPYGIQIYEYAARLSGDSVVRNYITEWYPTALRDFSQAQFFISVAIAGGVLALARQRVRLPDLLVLALFAALGLSANRNIPWWGIASAPILAPYLARVGLPPRLARLGERCLPRREHIRSNLVRAGVVGLIVVASLPWIKSASPLQPARPFTLIAERYPLAAVDFLLNHDYPTRLYALQTWGSYLDWAVWPRYQPMVDPSIELHPSQVWMDVIATDLGNVFWQDLLDKYGAEVLLLSRDEQGPLIQAVERSPRWQRVYSDAQAVIYVPASLGVPSR